MTSFVLQNDSLRLEFDKLKGTLIGVTAVETGWEILNRPELGLSFQLMVPMPGRRNNRVLGEKQKLTSCDTTDQSITFVWNGVTSEHGGTHDIRLTLQIHLEGQQAIYTLTIDNHSELTVENVYCPYLGDVHHPLDEAWFKSFSYNYATSQEFPLWPTFQNQRGYYGIDYPIQFAPWTASAGAPMAPYVLLCGAKQGLYVGIHSSSSELVAWHAELHPGYDNSLQSTSVGGVGGLNGHVPDERMLSGKPVATRFAAVHLPFILPDESLTLTPVALQVYKGGWQHGVDVYKQWRSTWMSLPRIPAWAEEPHAWQQLHINSPEDELRIPFRDLPMIGEDCARHGVKAIQLVGWNNGGQDQGNPLHEPDPRLGTKDELKEAIAKIQAFGIKLILFAKFTWADRATEWFRKELIRQAIKDPYGDYYMHNGYQYQTATQFLDINTKRLIPMCFLSEEYLKVCEQEFDKVLELGADGILFDECLHHSPALLCFDPEHGHRPGAPVYANDRELIHRFAKRARQYNPNYLFAGEACYDWEFEAYHLSYHRSENAMHTPLSRYMLPNTALMTAVTGFNDRNMLNQCLMYRYIISYEPYNFKGRLDDFPLTIAYGKQMDALRTELRDYLWEGEFRDKIGATVVSSDTQRPHHPYSVFLNRKNGKCGVVVVNYASTPITVQAQLDNGQPLNRYRLVEDAHWQNVSSGVTLPAFSAAVVLA